MNLYPHSGLTWVSITVLLVAGCGTAPSAEHRAAAFDATPVPARLSQEQAHDITMYALGLVGTPYRYDSNTPAAGFDCSGLIGHVYQSRAALAPPRTVSRLQYWGRPVPMENIRSGDLVLFARKDAVHHAGIYVGAGRFVHAPSTGGQVRLDSLTSTYWAAQQVAFCRP